MKRLKQLLAILMTVTMIMTGTSLGGFGALSFAENDQGDAAVSQEIQDDSQAGAEAAKSDADKTDSNTDADAAKDQNEINAESGYNAGELQAEVVLSDDSKWQITAEYTKKARIPENAELIIEEIDEKDTGDYLKETARKFKWSDEEQAAFARFINISITSKGNEVKPDADVEFTVKAKDVEKNSDTMHVVRFDADKSEKIVKTEELKCETTKDKELVFKTDECAVFGFVALKEAEAENSDSEEFVADGADLVEKTLKAGKVRLEGLMPEDAKATATDASEAKAVRKLEADGETTLAAYDIAIKANGDEYQPDEDNPIKVEIADKAIREDSILTIWHIRDDGTKEEVEDFTVSEGKVEFEATGFSVYAVIDHEEQTVENPRVEFHFIDKGATQHSGGAEVYYEGNPYKFENKSGDEQTTQILKDGESLEMIEDPSNDPDSNFYGWYVVNPYVISGTTDEYGIGSSDSKLYYTWPKKPDKIAFEKEIRITGSNVSIGGTVNWSLNGVQGEGAVDKDGNVHVFLAPLFDSYNFVNFMLYPRNKGNTGANTPSNSLMTRKMIARGSEAPEEVKISDIRSTSEDAVHLIFTGWEYKDENDEWQKVPTVDYSGAEIKEPGKDGVYLDISHLANKESIDLYPIFIEARWIDYVSGQTESGASYVASRFLESWGHATPPGTPDELDRNYCSSMDTSTRQGYDFDGWYAFAVIDPDTGEITNLTTPTDVEVKYLDYSGEHYSVKTKTINTTAVQITDGSGSVVYDGTYTLATDSGNVVLFSAQAGKLKLHDALNRMTLYAKWAPAGSQINIVYWTEKAQGNDYAEPSDPKDDYTSSAVKTLTTTELNSQLGTDFASGSPITLNKLGEYEESSVGILDRKILDDVGAVQTGEEKFYDLNTDLSDASVVLKGDGSTNINVYYSRKTFKLVFHIGRDGYIKDNGQQKPEYMSDYSDWDGNWIQFMFNDSIITNSPPAGLGYRPGPTARSYRGNYSMTFTDPDTGAEKTFTNSYAATPENVMGDYVPDDNENVYVITAKYGAYIGDRWPTPTNDNFSFTHDNRKSMYIWAAYYGSLYCRIANERSIAGNNMGNNPDVNGVYEYMSKELCSDRSGDNIINDNQVHHFVAYYGDTGKAGVLKNYHVLYEAIDGTYDPSSVTVEPGADYLGYNQTTWSAADGNVSAVDGHNFYNVSDYQVISNLEPQFQLGSDREGYDLVYSCYNTPQANEHHIYFFYRPKQYTLTFKYENETKEDTYYYTQTLVGANKYDPPEKEGYYFAGWYTNAAGVGEPFDFDTETMPSSNVVLYPILKVLQYNVKIDPDGGVIDHINYDVADQFGNKANDFGVTGSGYNPSQATYFTADYGTPIGEYTVDREYIALTEDEMTSGSATYYSGTKYYYVNDQFNEDYDGDWGLPPNLRNAVYMSEDQLRCYHNYYKKVAADYHEYYTGVTVLDDFNEFAAAYTSYPDQPYRHVNPASEHYSFMGWYQVFEDGSEASMPYNFNDPVNGEIELRAKWRLDGGYYVTYDPYYIADDGQGQPEAVAGELDAWTDPEDITKQLYADQSPTHVLRAPTNVTEGWVFRGWRVVRKGTKEYQIDGKTYYEWEPIQYDEDGDVIYYQPGDRFTIDSSLVTDAENNSIHMQAYYEPEEETYRKPEVTNLVLDANDDYGGYVNTTDSSSLPALAGPGSETINTSTELDDQGRPTQILLGDIQSNLALHLYKYATTETHYEETGTQFFNNSGDYLLIGFDENSDPMYPTTENPYIPAFAADSVISVQRTDSALVYAMWEPMIYATFVNTTDKPITVNLSGSEASTVRIVNAVTGEFGREAVTSAITIPAKTGDESGTLKVVFPAAVAGTDTITATAVNDHTSSKMSVSGTFEGLPHGEGCESIKYGKNTTYTGTLENHEDGIFIIYTEEPDLQVLYDVNGGDWTDPETGPDQKYYYVENDLYAIDKDKISSNNYKPTAPVHDGKVFVGWTTNEDIASQTDFSSETAVTWGDTTITPDEGSNVLAKVKSDYLWDFSQDPPFGQTLYAVWSAPVTVTFNVAYSNNMSANPLKLHKWEGPDTTDTEGDYVFYRSSPTSPYVTYTMAKGDRVTKPSDPTAHTDRPTWIFMRWLTQNNTTEPYRYNAKEPSDGNLVTYGFDFSQHVTEDKTLVTSWTTRQPQHFTFTVENNVVNGDPNDEFDYTIAVSDELVVGKLGTSTTNSAGVPDRRWGSFTTSLKNDQQYTVHVTVSYITNWGGANSVEIEVIDQEGTVIKSGQVIYCNNNTYKNFVSDYKYTLTVTQDAKDGYETTVRTENMSPEGSIESSTSDENRSFTFASGMSRTSSYASQFTTVNGYAAGDNSLDIIFTNTGSQVAPTGYSASILPFLILLTAGLLLGVTTLYFRRRREQEE